MYARVTLATFSAAQPESLPAELIGLDDATLADLPTALDPVPRQFRGVGYWPAVIVYPSFDGRSQTIAAGFDLVADSVAKTVTATARIRDLTPDEIAALPPLPVDPFAGFIPVYLLRQRAEKLGIWDELAAYLGQSPALLLKVTTLENGMVDPAYPDLLKGFDDLSVAQAVRAYLLAPPSFGVPDVPSA